MAVPAVTLDFPIAQRVGNRVCGLISGSVNVTSYDTAHPALTALTGLFKPSGKLRVSPTGVSSNGYSIRWDNATNSGRPRRHLRKLLTQLPSGRSTSSRWDS
jgi:hypothetical protein